MGRQLSPTEARRQAQALNRPSVSPTRRLQLAPALHRFLILDGFRLLYGVPCSEAGQIFWIYAPIGEESSWKDFCVPVRPHNSNKGRGIRSPVAFARSRHATHLSGICPTKIVVDTHTHTRECRKRQEASLVARRPRQTTVAQRLIATVLKKGGWGVFVLTMFRRARGSDDTLIVSSDLKYRFMWMSGSR